MTSIEIQQWMVKEIAELMEISPFKIDVGADIRRLGLDSVTMIQIAGNLSEWLGVIIEHDVLTRHKTITAISDFIVKSYSKTGIKDLQTIQWKK